MSREGFVSARFGDLVLSRDERLPNNGIHPLYSLTIKDGVTPKTDRYEREFLVTDKSSKKYKVIKTGDLVYNPSNLRWGAIATSFVPFAVLASPIYEVFYHKDPCVLDPYYLGALATSPMLMCQYLSRVEGTLVERTALKKDDFLEIEVSIPPLSEQKKIAEILSGIDTATMLLDAKVSKLNLTKISVSEREFAYTNFLHAEASGSVNSLRKKTLREVADVIDCKHRTPAYASEGFPVVRPRDVKATGINFDQCIKTSAEELCSLNEGINPQINDIVYSRNATLGVGALVNNKAKFAIGQDVCILRSKAINPKYFYYQLNSASFFRQVENLVSGSTFKRINLGAIRELQVITPDPSEQERVASALERIDNLIASLQQRREKIAQLKTSLVQDLLSGRKRVSV